MPEASQKRAPVLLVLLLCLCGFACSRPGNVSDQSTTPLNRHVPFRAASTSQGDAPNDSSFGLPDQVSASPNSMPFRDPQSLPAGTLLTIRLKGPISSDALKSSGTFEGEVDDPIAVEGATGISRGTLVSGRVEAARAGTRNSGYLRLTLNSIALSGRDLTLRTSSLFVRGKMAGLTAGATANLPVVRLEPGRRLTFHLSEPIYIPGPLTSSVQ